MKKPTVKMNLTGLQIMQSALKSVDEGGYRIQVGLFGDKNTRREDPATGLTNAEVGFIQEMGSVARKIPRRSFLWDTFALRGQKVMAQLRGAVENLFKKGKVDEYLKQASNAATNVVDEAFYTSGWGSWKPNKPSTIKRKGSSRPLIETGQLRRAITARVVRA